MRVTIDANGDALVGNVNDLNALDVVAPDRERVERGFARHGRVDGDHVWISRAWLAGQGPAGDEAWQEGFGKMIAYAESKGWTDPDGSVRAHVTFTGDP